MKNTATFALLALSAIGTTAAAEPYYQSRMIFPLQDKHVHGSSLALLPDGDLLAAWFHGSGERSANDVVIQGTRLAAGSDGWSGVFPMADTPNLPDCNPVLFVDGDERLWLFWIAVRANRWEHSILKYSVTKDYEGPGAPRWDWRDIIIPKPGEDFARKIREGFDRLDPDEDMWAEYAPPYTRMIAEAAEDPVKRQEGWMTRNHPVQLPSGRIVLPVYSDGFNLSMAVLSDDNGATWRAGGPMVGLAGIQPTIVRKRDGTLVAYMRDTGGAPMRVLKSESDDNGETWTVMKDTGIPNPSSSLQVLALRDGVHWAMVHNDTEHNRGRLSVALSDDEGETWRWKRTVGDTESYAYPSMLQDGGGRIHISYTFQTGSGKTIKHDVFDLEWVKEGN